MSIWIDEYEKVLNKLEEIKTEIDNIDCDNNDSCLRMKKVFNINYKILKNLDPELLSLKNIYNLIYNEQKRVYGNLCSCQGYLIQLLEFIKNEHFDKANDILDIVFNIIKPYILHKKRLGDPLAESVKIYKNEIEKHLNELKQIENEEEKIKEVIEKIYEYENELFVDDEKKDSIKTRIETILNDIENKKGEIYKFYNELFVDENEESIETTITNFFKEIENLKEKSKELKDEVEEILLNTQNSVKELRQFYVEIFGEIDEETNERKGGLKQEIEQRKKELESLKKEYEHFKENQEKRYQELYKKIESLLPGAVSAGLARAYQEKREKFEKQTKFWGCAFVIGMIGLFIAGFFIINKENNTLEDTFLHLLKYSPLYLPAIWLAFYAGRRRNENMRLEQKYAHKEALAKSYIGYKKQIEELQEKEKDELLTNLLKTSTYIIAEDPSYVLDKDNNEYHPFIESWKKFLDFFDKTKNKEENNPKEENNKKDSK